MTRAKRVRLVLSLGLALTLFAIQAQASTRVASLDVVVGEVAWMGTTTSSYDEWIELYNNTASPVGLAGWTLNAADGSPSISLHGTIPAGGYFLLEPQMMTPCLASQPT